MRITFILFGFILSGGWLAARQSIAVTPQSLADWTVVGAEAKALSAQKELTLPPGAQLARSFPTANLALTVVTNPVIGVESADWPVLEIGSAALVFGRTGGTGKLILVVGDSSPVETSFNFALDAAGRSLDPLVLSFARDGAIIGLAMAEKAAQFSVDPAVAGGEGQVVASAGITQAWAFESLTVTEGVSDSAQSTTGANSAGVLDSASTTLGQRVRGSGSADPVAGLLSSEAETKSAEKKAAIAPTVRSLRALELFTPPSVREARVKSVRNIAAKGER